VFIGTASIVSGDPPLVNPARFTQIVLRLSTP
jgi:hypothetical protein